MMDNYDERYNENEQYDREPLGGQPLPQEPANEADPGMSRAMPTGETGERRWAASDMGGLGSMGGRDWTEPRDVMSDVAENSLGAAPAETGTSYRSENLPTNDSFEDRGVSGQPTEEYGQGITREFTPMGSDPGIEQQDVLQSQQYEREEREQHGGFLGAVGDALGGLMGKDKREPREDEHRS